MKTIAHFGTYIHDLSAKLQSIKQKQDDERRKLFELRTLLRSAPDFDRVEVCKSQFNSISFHKLCSNFEWNIYFQSFSLTFLFCHKQNEQTKQNKFVNIVVIKLNLLCICN